MVKIDGSKVRSMREARGLTQLYLATAVNVTTDTISRWENKRYPKIKKENALKLAAALDVTIEEILDHHEDSPTGEEKNQIQEPESNRAPQGDSSVPDQGTPFSHEKRSNKIQIISLISFCVLVAAFFWQFNTAWKVVEMGAVRIVPSHVVPGQPFPVVIRVEISKVPASFILKEMVPANSKLVDGHSAGAVIDKSSGEIKWITKAKDPVVSIGYMLQSNSELLKGDTLRFSGLITQRKERGKGRAITGSEVATISSYHWADTDENGIIDDEEILVVYDDYNEVQGLTLDMELIEEIWFGSGYKWDSKTGQFVVLP